MSGHALRTLALMVVPTTSSDHHKVTSTSHIDLIFLLCATAYKYVRHGQTLPVGTLCTMT